MVRTIGDLLGAFTCLTYNGCSIKDYAVAYTDICNNGSQLRVL